MTQIPLATILLGATAFKAGNINDTYRGQVLLSDGSIKPAIIKDLNLVELCNELLAFCLARNLGLPVPDCFLGLARPSVLTAVKGPSLPDGARLVFVSTDVKVPNVTFRLSALIPSAQQSLLAEIIRWADLGKLYAFDGWIANIDRHPGNLLFGNLGEAWLIDHGHCLGGPTWSPGSLDPAAEFANRLAEWVTPFLTLDQKEVRKQEASAVEAGLVGFDADVPAKISRVEDLMPVEYVQALKAFLIGRSSQVTIHASKALGIPVLA